MKKNEENHGHFFNGFSCTSSTERFNPPDNPQGDPNEVDMAWVDAAFAKFSYYMGDPKVAEIWTMSDMPTEVSRYFRHVGRTF